MSTTDNTPWPDLIDQYTDAYANAPSAHLIHELGELYQRHPAITQARLNEAREAHIAGRIHSPWGFVLQEMRRHDTTRQQKPQDADRERDRETQTAERYIRNAGIYLPTQDELIDDTFGTHGRLKTWADDPELQARIVALWQHEHPRAIATDQAKLERAEHFKAHRAKPAPEPADPRKDEVPL